MMRGWVVLIVSALVAAANVRPASACASAPPQGEEVRIAEEEAIIIWDPATRTEHFIRRAAFRSSARAFGFLVPTPTVPQLGEVDAGVFGSLADGIAPERRVDHSGYDVQLTSLLLSACGGGLKASKDEAGAPAAAAVRVLAIAHVAGFDAVTVEADDPTALAKWLSDHGFATTPALTRWLGRYVDQKWKITAFLVATDEAGGTEQRAYELGTRAVRMSFSTDRPFYPYREPEAAPSMRPEVATSGRLLRVFFLADQRHAATVGSAPWSARVLHAAPIELPAPLVPLAAGHRFATVFVDESFPRRGTDEIFFAPSTDRAEVRQPPIVIRDPTVIEIPIELILVAVIGLSIFIARRVKRRHAPLGRM